MVLTYTASSVDTDTDLIGKTLSLGGVPFNVERVSSQHTASSDPLSVPALQVNGETYHSAQSILRYAARLSGLYPPTTEPVAVMLVDEILGAVNDLCARLLVPKPTDEQRALLPSALARIDRRLRAIAADAFFQADKSRVFVHHVVIWHLVQKVRAGETSNLVNTQLEEYSTMTALYDKVETLSPPATIGHLPIDHHALDQQVMPAQLKLTYLHIPGRAGSIRTALHIGGIPFEDERISWDELDARANQLPNGQLPVLLVNGVTVAAQSMAILRYVGTLTGLYPAHDRLEAMKIDEVISRRDALDVAMDPAFLEDDPATERAIYESLLAGVIPATLDALNQRIARWKETAKSSAPFVAGGAELTIADLVVSNLVRLFKSGEWEHVPVALVDEYPHLVEAYDAVESHPRVVDWNAAQRSENEILRTTAK